MMPISMPMVEYLPPSPTQGPGHGQNYRQSSSGPGPTSRPRTLGGVDRERDTGVSTSTSGAQKPKEVRIFRPEKFEDESRGGGEVRLPNPEVLSLLEVSVGAGGGEDVVEAKNDEGGMSTLTLLSSAPDDV